MRKTLILGALAVALLLSLLGTRPDDAAPSGPPVVSAAAASTKPNVVMVMADDMRTDDLRFMPSVRRLLVGRGLSFRNSFSPYPLCCPARASFLTGRYAHNHHVFSHEDPYGFRSFDDHATIATALHQAGYHTGFVGKYLNGYGAQPSLVTGGPSFRYVPAGWTDWYGAVERPADSGYPSGGTYNYLHTLFNVNGRIDDTHKGQYQTNVLGSFARGLVTKYHRSPQAVLPLLLGGRAALRRPAGEGRPGPRAAARRRVQPAGHPGPAAVGARQVRPADHPRVRPCRSAAARARRTSPTSRGRWTGARAQHRRVVRRARADPAAGRGAVRPRPGGRPARRDRSRPPASTPTRCSCSPPTTATSSASTASARARSSRTSRRCGCRS